MTPRTLIAPAVTNPDGELWQPMQVAAAASDANIDQLERRIRNGHIREGVMWCIVLAMVMAVIIAVCRIQTYTYVIEVAETGQVRTVGMLPQAHRGVTPSVIAFVIDSWIYNMRRVGIDGVLLNEQHRKAGAFMTTPVMRASEAFRKERLELLKQGSTTKITVLTLIPMTPDAHTLEIEWEEQVVSRQGTEIEKTRWRAIVNLAIYSEKDLPKDTTLDKLRNPLGIFVTDYAWQRKIPPDKETTP